MLLPDCIVSAYSEGFSGVYVYCKNPQEVSEKFLKLFEVAFNNAMDELEEDMECVVMEKVDKIPLPAAISHLDDEKFLIRLAPLFLSMNDGARADNDYLTTAFEKVLEELVKTNPDLSYYGMIAYEWYDEHCGDIVSYEINSNKNVNFHDITYPFVKDIFAEIFSNEALSDEFWSRMEDNLYDCDEDTEDEIVECFATYDALSDEVLEKIGQLLGECDFDD